MDENQDDEQGAEVQGATNPHGFSVRVHPPGHDHIIRDILERLRRIEIRLGLDPENEEDERILDRADIFLERFRRSR